MKLLLVDDDRDLVELLVFALGRAGFEVLPAYDSPAALVALDSDQPDIVVLDLGLGMWSGFDLLRDVRARSDVPVIILTGLNAEDDKVRGLELGADDYLTKPFSHRELLARIRALLRRRGHSAPAPRRVSTRLEGGGLVLDVAEHTVSRNGQPLNLTVTEFRLLHFLMTRAGTVVSTRELIKHVWGYDDPSGRDMVRVTVYRLRRKLEDDPIHPQLLHTISGVGFILRWDSPSRAGG